MTVKIREKTPCFFGGLEEDSEIAWEVQVHCLGLLGSQRSERNVK